MQQRLFSLMKGILKATAVATFIVSGATSVFAVPIVSQTLVNQQVTYSTGNLGYSNGTIYQNIGTGLSGVLGSATFYAQKTDTDGDLLTFGVYCFNDSDYDYGDLCSGSWPKIVYASPYLPFSDNPSPVTINGGTPYSSLTNGGPFGLTFDSTKYYQMIVQSPSNLPDWGVRYFGGNGSFPLANTMPNDENSTTTLQNLAFILDTASSSPFVQNASSTSYIVAYNSPITSPTGSTLVSFDFDYWNTGNEGFDKAGVEIRDVTAGLNYLPIEDDVVSSGGATYTESFTLTQGHAHLWRPYLRNSVSSTIPTLYGNWVGLIDVVTDSASSTPYITENASTTAFFDFLNVPTLLRTKLPFAYIYQFSDIINGLSSTTASTTGSVTYDFATYASGTPLASIGEFTLFSTTTVTQFLSPTLCLCFVLSWLLFSI